MITGFRFRGGFLGRVILRVEENGSGIYRDATLYDMPELMDTFKNRFTHEGDRVDVNKYDAPRGMKIKGFD